MRSTIAISISSASTASAARGSRPRATRRRSIASESIVSRERIACDFERLDGYLFCAPEHDEAFLDRELAAAHRAGLHNVAKIGRAPMAFDTGPCLRFPNQAQFHPLKYLAGLAERDRARRRPHLCRDARRRRSTAARTRPSRPRRGTVSRRQHRRGHQRARQRSRRRAHQAGAVHDLRDRRARAARHRRRAALYWDTGDPYHYVRSAGRSTPITIC